MRVVVYVEGPSDKLALDELLDRLIKGKALNGIAIKTFSTPNGHNKHSVIAKAPRKALHILKNSPDAYVIAMPDLYPKDVVFEHTSAEELINGIEAEFDKVLVEEGIQNPDYRDHFKVFCFKYEMEALILAAEIELKAHLGVDEFERTWVDPVENHNHGEPPKQVVKELFRENGQKYVETNDAPTILGAADYKEIAEKCQQCFKPFINFLESL